MLNLTLFEIKRKWRLHFMILGIYELANALLVYKIQPAFKVDPDGGVTMGLIFLLGMLLPVLSMADAVNSMRLEIKNPSRDLYFLLPQSAFKKIGSKILVAGISMGTALGVYVLTAMASVQFLTKEPLMNELLKGIQKMPADLAYVVLMCLISYMVLIGMIYLSYALFRSFFSQWKFGGLVTTVIFVAVAYGVEKITSPLAEILMNQQSMRIMGEAHFWSGGWQLLSFQMLILAVIYGATSWLFEHRANFD